MNEAESVCEREKGKEKRVKVVIDGRPGLRPLPHSGQGACFCRRLPALPPSIPVFIPPSNSPTQYYCAVSVASLMPFIHPFSSLLALHPVGTISLIHTFSFSPHQTVLLETITSSLR